VVHVAAKAYVDESVKNPILYFENNIQGTVNLLDALIKNNVSSLIFSSSCATYGEVKEIRISENHSQNPVNPSTNTGTLSYRWYAEEFEPLSDGKEKGEKIEYKEEFVIGNTIHSAGAKNVFEIGRIIGGLAEVDDNDDREDRKSSFIINFNKTYTVSMTIKIPDNKSIEGIELLNKNISNSVGTISSTAKIENGQIKWKIEKKLNAGVYESSIWTDYLKLTDFGSQLTTSKILLY
jgi:hypothetical protein